MEPISYILGITLALITWWSTRWYYFVQRPKIISFSEILESLENDSIGKREKSRLVKKYDQILEFILNKHAQPLSNEAGMTFNSILANEELYLVQPGNGLDNFWLKFTEESAKRFLYITPSGVFLQEGERKDPKAESEALFQEIFEGLDEIDIKILTQTSNKLNHQGFQLFVVNLSQSIFSSSDQINTFYILFRRKIISIFPKTKIVFEVCLPIDLIQEINSKIINKLFVYDFEKVAKKSKALEYIDSRNRAFQTFNKGGLFVADFSISNYEVPSTLTEKLFLDAQFPKRNEWKIINIYGPPGSGKTDLLKYLLDNYLNDENSIKIILSTNIKLSPFQEANSLTTQDAFIHELLSILTDPANNYLKDFDSSEESLMAIRDVLFQVIKYRGKELILIIDDYHVSKEAMIFADRIIEKNWNIKLVLVGRPKMEFKERNSFNVETKLWSLDQAKEILNFWLPNNTALIEDALNTKWVYDEGSYSTYLLRIIVNHIQNIRRKDSSLLLYEEIKNILIHVYNELKELVPQRQILNINQDLHLLERLIFNTEGIESITQLREIVEKERNNIHKEFDLGTFINDLGLISLMGRLANEDKHLDINTIMKISKIINNKEEAEKLLISGSNVGVFFPYNPSKKSCEWKDSLIADGCLALRLNYDLSQMSRSVSQKDISFFTETLRLLKEKNSIYILKLALDEASLSNLIKLNIEHNIDFVEIIFEDLLTDAFLNKIKTSKNGLQNLFNEIIKNTYKLDEKNDSYLHIARFLARLIAFDKDLEPQIISLFNLDSIVGTTALATYSLTLNNKSDFFKTADAFNVDREKSLEIALKLWEPSSIKILINRIREYIQHIESNKKEKICILWQYKITNKKIDFFREILDELLQITREDQKESEIYLLLLETTFIEFVNMTGGRINRSELDTFVQILKINIFNLKEQNKYATANKLIKWLVYFLKPDLYRTGIEWEIINKGDFAIPQMQYEEKDIISILTNIPPESPFSLPFSYEIRLIKDFSIGKENASFIQDSLEIVADRFPKDFKYEPEDYTVITNLLGSNTIRLQATQIAMWDGNTNSKEVGFIDRKNQLTQKVRWRPKINLAKLSVT
jgi:hypothetical protein